MSNILNIYDAEERELVLANLFFYPVSYEEAARIACAHGAEFVHGIDPVDIKRQRANLMGGAEQCLATKALQTNQQTIQTRYCLTGG